jgi:murein tripeptide amidase MpaA
MMENADDKFVLRDFIQNRMRMSHIYQPVMIKALLANDGQATTEEIAKALLAYDQSQVEYYSLRTALLHKSVEGRTSPIPRQTYPMASVTGMPRAV